MCSPKWLKRRKQSRGHGVHSPFAYEVITKVLCSPYGFYAFYDIPNMLRAHGVDPGSITPFNHLSFRLVDYFKSRSVLEVNPGAGVNTLFLMAASSEVNCTWMEMDAGEQGENRSLIDLMPRQPRFTSRFPFCGEDPFDAIFVNLSEAAIAPIDLLLELGHETSFWVIHPIHTKRGKQYWKQIVNDKRIRMTFDKKETGIVFPRRSVTPSHYLI